METSTSSLSHTERGINALPSELIYEIVAYISDRRDLAAASLAGHDWLLPSRSMLLRDLVVYDDRLAKDFYTFTAFLENSPAVRPLIRHLTLHGCRTYHYKPVITSHLLDRILCKLPALRSLHLVSIAFSREVVPPDLDDRLVGSYQLDELSMSRCGTTLDTAVDFLQCLSMFSRLGQLSLTDLQSFCDVPLPVRRTATDGQVVTVYDFVESLTSPPLPTVGGLHMEKVMDDAFLCKVLVKANVSRNLERITYNCRDRFGTTKWSFLPRDVILLIQVCPNLEHLTLNLWRVPWCTTSLRDIFSANFTNFQHDLAKVTALRHVVLYLGLYSGVAAADIRSMWRVLVAVINMLPTSVRKLELVLLDTHQNRHGVSPEDRCHVTLWCIDGVDVEDLFEPFERYENLEEVWFRSMDGVGKAEEAHIVELLSARVPKGVLRFDSSVNETRENLVDSEMSFKWTRSRLTTMRRSVIARNI